MKEKIANLTCTKEQNVRDNHFDLTATETTFVVVKLPHLVCRYKILLHLFPFRYGL